MNATPWVIASIWLVVLATGAMFGLALRALWIERREGLRTSHLRAVALAGVLAAAVSVAVVETVPHHAAPPPAPTAQSARADLEARRATLQQELRDIETALQALDAGHAPAAPAPVAEVRPVPLLAAFTVVVLGLMGVIVLLGAGAPGSLPFAQVVAPLRFRGKKARTDATATDATPGAPANSAKRGDPSERLHAAALANRYDEALEAGAELIEDALPLLERLDAIFLRAYAAVQRVASDGVHAAGGEKTPKPADGPAPPPLTPARRKELLGQAERDLAKLTALAPNMAEARYLAATLRALDARYEQALADYRACESDLATLGLPFAHNESACLIELASSALAAADGARAQEHFAEVARLHVLADQVPFALVAHGLSAVRQALGTKDADAARKAVAQVRETPGLPDDARARASTLCDVYEIVVLAREGDDARTLAALRTFLEPRMPAGLPVPDEQTAEEFLFPPVAPADLALPPAVFRGFFVMVALAEVRLRTARNKRGVTAAALEPVRVALLRALQFEPRQREALAVLGALDYWFVPGGRPRGVRWLRAAVTMGVQSAVVRRLLDRHETLEVERQHVLERFLGASSRFLTDPTVAAGVRRALVTELGRFADFQPLVIELGEQPPPEPRSPSLAVLRERARYVAGLADTYHDRRTVEERAKLAAVDTEFRRTLEQLEGTMGRLEDLERQVMTELGKAVLA